MPKAPEGRWRCRGDEKDVHGTIDLEENLGVARRIEWDTNTVPVLRADTGDDLAEMRYTAGC